MSIKKFKVNTAGWINQDWLNTRMDFKNMETFIMFFLNYYNYQKLHYDIIQDIYADVILDIYSGKIHLYILPSDKTLREIVNDKFKTLMKKMDRIDKKFQKMGREEYEK